jgi:hypothetical protein
VSDGGDKSGREIELKLRVDDLAALMKIAIATGSQPQPTITQTNAFFDTRDRALGVRGLVVRLREERTRTSRIWLVTAKGSGHRSGTLTDVLEEEVEIDEARAKAIRAGADPVAALDGGPPSRQSIVSLIRSTLQGRRIILVGQFQNERTRVDVDLPLEGGSSFRAVLELDRTRFPPTPSGAEQVHHEVEMEIPAGIDPEAASRALEDLFARAGVVGRAAPGKARRFFAAVRGERLE